jgi:hypothetical protein
MLQHWDLIRLELGIEGRAEFWEEIARGRKHSNPAQIEERLIVDVHTY